jgi:transketolase
MDKNILIKRILELAHKSKEGHIPSSLSILDILYVIYFNIQKEDRFVLSKGHAALGLYVILEHFKKIDSNLLENFCSFDSNFGGHPCSNNTIIEASTGSLGHGLPIALGMALAKKIKKEKGNIYVVIGDGECNEGTIWESALLASNHKLDNLYCFLDYNHSGDRALDLGEIHFKFNSFGWNCITIDGHDHEKLKYCIAQSNYNSNPNVIICKTIKGKGIDFMENNPEWHHKIPDLKILESIN